MVADGEGDFVVGDTGGDFDQPTTGRQCLEGIFQEVIERLFDLVAIESKPRWIFCEVERDLHIAFLEFGS